MNTSDAGARAPRHLWIVGGLSLLWNAFGATDYVLTNIGNEAYLSQFTPEQLAYFTTFPALATAAWAFGVWGALAGSILLLLRSRMAVSFGYQFGASDVMSVMGDTIVAFTVLIVVVGIALFVYSQRQAAGGVLR
ncbi:MAG: hypothetical protein MUC71_13350 [Steroidobacteraceae bacterium]|nr:hypothetical protein [Steroidobacteraceae bacterium]